MLPPQPDLLVTGLSVSPSSGLQSGGSLTVNWNDSNNGLGAVSNSFSDQVQIVNTTTGQTLATAAVLYNETSRGPLAAGGAAAQQYTFQLPNGAAGVGQWQITVTNDIYDQVTKYNPDGTPEASSTATVTATSALAPYPNLVAATVSGPATTVLGQPVTVSWTDANQGTAAATGTWTDGIYLYISPTDTNPTFVGSTTISGTLPAGQSTPQSANADAAARASWAPIISA